MGNLTLGSLFSGSGGFELAGQRCGVTPVWASEVEPFAIAATRKHFPNLKHLGDISKIDGGKIEPVDIITAGFCCQDLSVAGKREGLHGARSGLFFQAIRIIREMQEATNYDFPKAVVLENVMGLLSSAQGEDFITVMQELFRLGFYVDANCLDAQEFGVAQRRKCVFICAISPFYYPASLNSQTRSDCCPQGRHPAMVRALKRLPADAPMVGGIVSRAHEPVRVKLSEILERDADPSYVLSAKACLGILRRAESRGKVLPAVLSQALRAQAGLPTEGDPIALHGTAAFEPGAISRLRSPYFYEEHAGTLRAAGGDNRPAVVYDARGNGNGDVAGTLTGDHQNRVTDYTSLVAYGISSYDSNAMKSPNPHAGIYEAKTARTLDTQGGSPACNQGGMAVVAFAENQRSEVRDLRDCAGALAAQPGMKQQTFIAQEKPVYSLEGNGQRPSHKGSGVSEEVSPTLNSVEQHQVAYAMTTGNYTQVCEEKAPCLQARDYKDPPIISRPHYIVRRLTPKECAVLQGFPRDWCAGLETPEPTEEDIAFWAEVFETQRRVIGTSKKPKSRSQIIKWLQNPHTDGKEYQLWGNGLCADCASFVLQAVVAIAQDVVE